MTPSSRTLYALALLLWAAPCVSQDRPYRTAAALQQAPAEEAQTRLHLTALDPSHTLDSLFLAEAIQLSKFAGWHTPLFWSSRTPSISHPELGIILNRAQLDSLSRAGDFAHLPELAAYVLAHEKAHQLQYDTYGPNVYIRSGCEFKRVLEAQADIFAGHYLFHRSSAYVSEQLAQERTVSLDDPDFAAFMQALDVSFALGERDYAFTTHPSREGRRGAVRLGLTYAIVESIENAWDLAPDSLYTDSLLAVATATLERVRDAIDMRHDQSMIDWSLEMARRVAYYNRPAIADLVRVRYDVEWSETRDHPYVFYEAAYRNVGDHTLSVDLMAQVFMVDREDSNDTFMKPFVSGRHHQLTLAPGQTAAIGDSLMWITRDGSMPQIVVPPDPTAMVSVSYVDAPNDESQTCRSYPSIEAADTSDLLKRIHFQALLSDLSSRGFTWLVGGPGEQYIEASKYRRHPSAYDVLGAEDASIYLPNVPDLPPFLTARLYVGSDSTAARASFDTYTNTISTSVPEWRTLDRSDYSSTSSYGRQKSIRKTWVPTTSTGSLEVTLYMQEHARTDGSPTYEVSLEFQSRTAGD